MKSWLTEEVNMSDFVHVLDLGLELLFKTRLQDINATQDLQLLGLGP